MDNLKLKVLIVDDHKILRNGLTSLLKVSDIVSDIYELDNGKAAIDFVKKHKDIDVILMDIKMPDINGIEATKIILDENPDIKIIALTMHDDKNYISEMVNAGAKGYLLKNTEFDELVFAIKEVYKGDMFFSSQVTSIITTSITARKPKTDVTLDQLTKREIQILKLIAEEYTNQEIADKLFLSPRTIDTHRRNLLIKIGARNTAGLVKFAIKHKLI